MDCIGQVWNYNFLRTMLDQLLPIVASSEDNGHFEFQWETFLPLELFCLEYISRFIHYKRVQLAYVIFAIISVGLLGALVLGEYDKGNINGSIGSILFYVLFISTALTYIFLPPLYMLYLKDILKCEKTKKLFSESMKIDTFFKTRSQIICHINFGLVITSIIMYATNYPMKWYFRLLSTLYAPIYTFPNVMAFTMCVFVLDAHRVQIQNFLAQLQEGELDSQQSELLTITLNSAAAASTDVTYRGSLQVLKERNICINYIDSLPQGSEVDPLEDGQYMSTKSADTQHQHHQPVPSKHETTLTQLWKRYYALHIACHYTSSRWGKMMVLLFAVSFLIVSSTVWDISRHLYPATSMIGYSLYSFVLLHEFMVVLVMANESGHLICNRLSSIAMGRLLTAGTNSAGATTAGVATVSPVEAEAVHALVGCLSYVKVHVTFQGEFALRSRMLIAIVGSIIGAVFSAIFL